MPLATKSRPHQVAESAFIAPTATVIGDATIGERSTVLFGAVIRGDSESICIGNQTNVQDQCVLHADPGFPCILGDRVSIGHAAVIHGATIEDDVLIGIRAVVLNGATIGQGSLIAAGSVVTEGTIIPPGSFVAGTPAKVKGPASERHRAMIAHAAKHYAQASQDYLASENPTLADRPMPGG